MANLPVREMVLYKHGVGFFVRQGEVEGEKVALTFRSDEINDVLKSLAAFDQAGGQVLGIHYQTPMDIQARLASSSINLSQTGSLRDLLRDLRGRDCELSFELTAGSPETLQGRVIGMDEVYTQEEFVANISLLTAQGVRIFPYNSLRSVRIFDEQSSHDLTYFLDTSMAEDDRRVVTIRLSAGQHDLAVYYVAPSPTWRVSYRLVAESDKEANTGKALIQGWGLFDNRLEEDLEDVRVTLVAGQPISFIYELYASRIPMRPTVQDATRIAPGPIEFAGATPDFDSMSPDELMKWMESLAVRQGATEGLTTSADMMVANVLEDDERLAGKGDYIPYGWTKEKWEEHLAKEQGKSRRMAAPAPQMSRTMAASAPLTQAETKDTGETFQYVVTAPVSIKRGESALVPIIGKEISYQRELLYNAAKLPNHPVASLRFDNKTGLTLERGPVTVVEDGDYKGEAVIPFTKEDNQVYVPYAVELGIKVTERPINRTVIAGLKIENAALFEQVYVISEVTYTIENTTAKPQVVTIEAPIRTGYELFETSAPAVETANERRWPVDVKARGKAEFVRKERFLRSDRREIRNLDYRSLSNYLENKWLDKSIYEKLREVLDTIQQMRKAQNTLNELANERNEIYRQQEQLRANLGALQPTGQEAPLRNRLLKQLESSQDRLDAIDKERAEAQAFIESAEKRIQEMINNLGK